MRSGTAKRGPRWLMALMTAFAIGRRDRLFSTSSLSRQAVVKWAGAVIPPMAATQMTRQ
ncbi:MAG: hypothetical protein IPM25_03600 [Chloracidobacterium sp.]|nr:hypothetical protein [Chloracidobacterium sp.]